MNRTLRHRSTALLAAVSVLALAGCSTSGAATTEEGSPSAASAETVSVEHAQGTTDVPVDPEDVITFDLGVLDSLRALGEDVQGLPRSGSLPQQFAEYASDDYVNAGSMKEPDLEAVAE